MGLRFFVLLCAILTTCAARAQGTAATPVYNVVFIGDSITAGIGTQDRATEAAPVVAGQELQKLLGGTAAVYISNQGQNGHDTVNFLPGGGDFSGVEAGAKQLEADHPGQLIFSIMLGTNDCSSNGVTTGSPVSAADYAKNLKQIIDKLLAEYPDSKFVINHSIWFSPNTHNAADYTGSAAADRLKSYFPAIDTLVGAYASSNPHHVFVGDTDAYDYFSIHFQAELNGENGTFGTFFLHPNPTGAQSLGKFWATAIAKVLEAMKRSEINALLRSAEVCFLAHGWTLPPQPQWDVTDFGLGDYRSCGLVAINLANEPEYCEKLMYAQRDMRTPAHCHAKKKEDIICRWGELCLLLWKGRELDRTGTLSVKINGHLRDVAAGSIVRLQAGERITLVPGVYHEFYPGSAECIIGEVSTANDDLHDNFFVNPDIGRFPGIEEDEAAMLRLVSER